MEYMESKMQDYMEAGMNEHDELCEALNPPMDWSNPEWKVEDKVHNWRNYVSDEVKGLWPDMSGRQRLILAANFNDMAIAEHWDIEG